MTPLRRIAVIGNSLPRRCGIATFTTDLQQAISTSHRNLETSIVAMTDRGQAYDYPAAVVFEIKDDNIEEYIRAADFLNAGRFDAVSLQHEFGIFGGEAGAHILVLLSRLTMPVVTTLHTVLAEPTAIQRAVIKHIVEASSKVVVMANKGRELLRSVYQVPDDKIEIIAHGIPDVAFVGPDAAKARLGFGGRSVVLTFGLLSPNKGIEVMIDAMPSILKRRAGCGLCRAWRNPPPFGAGPGRSLSREPDGAGARTWRRTARGVPRSVRRSRHAARIHLNVRRLRHAVSQRGADDVGNAGLQLRTGKASGLDALLARARIAGRGRGILVPFGDAAAIGREIAALLTDDRPRGAICRRAYAASRTMTWQRAAERYVSAFENARQGHSLKVVARSDAAAPESRSPAPPRCKSAISCRCATIPACFSTRYIRCRIARTAIASMITPARCCWPAPSTIPASSACRRF